MPKPQQAKKPGGASGGWEPVNELPADMQTGGWEPVAEPKAEAESPSLWDRINAPLVSGSRMLKTALQSSILPFGMGGAASRVEAPTTEQFREEGQRLDPNESPLSAAVRRGGASTIADIGDTAASQTSPAAIGMTALGGAGNALKEASAVSKIAKVARSAVKTTQVGASGAYGGKAVENLAEGNPQSQPLTDLVTTGEANPDELQSLLFNSGQIAGSGAGALDATKGMAPNTAHKIMNTKMGVPQDALKYTNPGEAVVKEGLYGNTRKGLLDKVTGAKNEVGAKIDPALQSAAAGGTVLDTAPAFDPVRDTMSTAQREQNVGTHNKALGFLKEKTNQTAIDPQTGELVVTDTPRNMVMDPMEATTLKRGVGRLRWTGEPDSASLESARRGTYGNLKEAINTAVPEVAPLNERYAGLNEAEAALEPQAREGMKLSAPHVSDYVAGSILGGATGMLDTANPIHWAEAALAGVAAKKALGSMPLASRIAYWLGDQSKLPEAQARPQPGAQPGVVLPPAGPVQPALGGPVGNAPQLNAASMFNQPPSTLSERLALPMPVTEGEYVSAGPGHLLPPQTTGPFEQPGSPVTTPPSLPGARGRKLSTVTKATPEGGPNLFMRDEQAVEPAMLGRSGNPEVNAKVAARLQEIEDALNGRSLTKRVISDRIGRD